MPRWTPPSITPSSETSSSSCKKQAASMAVVIPEAALKEGLSGDALSSPSAPEPVVGTPDGGSGRGFIPRARLGKSALPFSLCSACSRFLGTLDNSERKDPSLVSGPCPLAYVIHSFYFLLDFLLIGRKDYIKLFLFFCGYRKVFVCLF